MDWVKASNALEKVTYGAENVEVNDVEREVRVVRKRAARLWVSTHKHTE